MGEYFQTFASYNFPVRRRGNELKFMFSQDMRLGEHTSRPASVNLAALFAAKLCAQQGAKPVEKGYAFFRQLLVAAVGAPQLEGRTLGVLAAVHLGLAAAHLDLVEGAGLVLEVGAAGDGALDVGIGVFKHSKDLLILDSIRSMHQRLWVYSSAVVFSACSAGSSGST